MELITSLLIMVLTAQPGDCIVLENPEAHIHPRGQAEFGKLMSLAASAGIQIIVETHSDHIVNGVRVAIKNGIIDRHFAVIQFFNRVNHQHPEQGIFEQYSVVRKIEIDSRGELSEYPDDFLDEWDRQLRHLI